MARKARIHQVVPELPHHVVLRGNNRRRLFSYNADRLKFCQLLVLATKKTGCLVHHLSLLSNHIHMLVTPPSVEALSHFVRRAAQPYAQSRNRQRGGTGKLFEQRFWSRPVECSEYLAVVSAYIDLNPEQAGVGPRLLRWSTKGYYEGYPHLSSIPTSLLTPSPWYLDLGKTCASRHHRYRAWLQYYLEHQQRLRESFTIAQHAEEGSSNRNGEPPHSKRLERPDRSSAR